MSKLFVIVFCALFALAAAQLPPGGVNQREPCSSSNNNCDWIIGHWEGIVTSAAISSDWGDSFIGTFRSDIPFATNVLDLYCLDLEQTYNIPYSCDFHYREDNGALEQICWWGATEVPINDLSDDFDDFVTETPAWSSTQIITSLDGGITSTYSGTGVSFTQCAPYDVINYDTIIGNLWDSFSDIPTCPSSEILPAQCSARITTTTTASTTTTPSTTTTTTPSTTTSSTTTTSTTTTTTTSTTTTSTTTTTTTPTTTTTTTPTTTTTTSSTRTNPLGRDVGIFEGESAIYVFTLKRVRPASFPHNFIVKSDTFRNTRNNVCDIDNNYCDWLVGVWNGYVTLNAYAFVLDAIQPYPVSEEEVRCTYEPYRIPLSCTYGYNEENGQLDSNCYYSPVPGGIFDFDGFSGIPTFEYEAYEVITTLFEGYNIATGPDSDVCVPFDRIDSDSFVAQFYNDFTDLPNCPSSPDTVLDCVDGFNFGGSYTAYVTMYRVEDANWPDWDAAASLSVYTLPLALLIAFFLAFF